MNKRELLSDIKEKPVKYIGFLLAMSFVLFFVLHNIGNTTKKTKKNSKETQTVLKSKTKINDKTKNKEKLLMATNPEARQAELKDKFLKYSQNDTTVLKNKYKNSPTAFNETIMQINKNKEKENKELLKLKAELLKQKRLLKDKEEELEKIKINKIQYNNKYKKIKIKKRLKPETQKQLLLEALGTKINNNNNNNKENKVFVFNQIKKQKIVSKTSNIDKKIITKDIRFNIVPGSSFYGRLETPIYSQYTNIETIITINNSNFNNCKFLGKVKYLQYKGLAIDIDRVACADGYVQKVNAKALRIKDLKPIFSDSIDRHIFPKVVLGSLDTLINLTRINDTTTADGGTLMVSQNASLIDEILKDEYNRVKEDDEMANPQSLVVVFY